MKQQPTPATPLAFIASGGEMGERVRAFNWSQTPVGPASEWPQGLKAAVRIMLNSRYPMFVWWGPELTNIYNDAYIPILGARHPLALGQSAPHIWSDIWDVVGPQAQLVVEENRATWNESVLLMMERHGYAEETYFTFSYSPVPDDAGGIGGVFCACSEDTQRVIGERQMALLRDLAAITTDARSWQEACLLSAGALNANPRDLPFAMIYVAEPDGSRLVLAGASGIQAGHEAAPPAARLDGSSPWPFPQPGATRDVMLVEELQKTFDSPLPAGAWQQPPAQAALVPIAATGQTGRGGVLVAGLNPFRLFDDGYRNFVMLVAGQISASIASAQAYEEEKRRAEALAELDRAKTTFFSNVSHEFRTPLTLMLGPVEDLLQAGPADLEPETREKLELVHRNSLRLLKLVNTMLDFSRIEAGRLRAHFEPVDLAAFTAELASVFRAAIERAGLRLIVNCPPLGQPVYVDRDMWEKIVLNLLSNAFKFTEEGEIEVRLEARDGQARLTVRDTGVGISAEELPRIFDRFHRAKGSRGRTYEGTGIGLSLVQELVKLHGGAVEVESVLDQGSRFVVTMPLGKEHLDRDRLGAASDRPPTTGVAQAFLQEAERWDDRQLLTHGDAAATGMPLAPVDGESQRRDARPRIVWADDNADMRDYVRRLLSDRFQVVAVADGQAALQAARKEPPDLVLADVMMPRLDGLGLVRALRSDPQLRSVPAILLSARADEDARIEGMEAGADDYLVKPFSARELLARVESYVKLAEVRAEMKQALRRSEERYRAIVEGQAEMVCRFRPDGTLLFVNGAYARARGATPDELVGANFWNFIKEEDRPAVRAMLDRLHQGAPEIRIENRFETAEGVRWTLWTNRALAFDDAGGATELQSVGIDITDRKLAEAALRESEERFRDVFEHAGVSVWLEDFSEVKEALDELKAQGVRDFRAYFAEHPEFVQRAVELVRVIDVNKATLQMLAAESKEQLLGSLSRSFTPATMAVFQEELVILAEGRQSLRSESEIRTLDGRTLTAVFTIDFGPSSRDLTRVVVTLTDVTARKQAEDALRMAAQRDRYRAQLADFLRPLTDPVEVQTQAARILGEHLGASRAFYGEAEAEGRQLVVARDYHVAGVPSVAGRHDLDNFGPALMAELRAGRTLAVANAAAEASLSPKELDAYASIDVAAYIAVPLVKGDRFVALLGVHQASPRAWTEDEISVVEETAERTWAAVERARADRALRQLNETLEQRVEQRTRQVRELATRLTMAEQEQRRDISQILHDDLQQLLYAVELKMVIIQDELGENGRPELRADLDEARRWIEQAITTTRQLTIDLSPPILQNEGLADAVDWLRGQMRDLHGLEIAVEAQHRFYLPDQDLRVLLFQIVRELLFNVKKHSRVNRATVELQEDNGHLVIRVLDDGRGFDVSAWRAGGEQGVGFGLYNISERLGLIGGRLEIDSRVGGGTRVTAYVPLPSQTQP